MLHLYKQFCKFPRTHISSGNNNYSIPHRSLSVWRKFKDWFFSTDIPTNRGLFDQDDNNNSKQQNQQSYEAFLNPHLQANNTKLIRQLKIPKSPINRTNHKKKNSTNNQATSTSYSSPRFSSIPRPPSHTTFHTHHSILRYDNYAYLENKHNPITLAYLQAENNYTNSIMNIHSSHSIQSQIESELHNRPPDELFPDTAAGYSYFVLNNAPYPRYCRVKTVHLPTGNISTHLQCQTSPHIHCFLDLNRHSRSSHYIHLSQMRFDREHNLLAYTIDTVGNERYQLHVKNLITNQELIHESIPNALSCAFNYNSTVIYYTVTDETNRPYCVKQHILGSSIQEDSIIYVESNENFIVDINLSKDRHYLFISSSNRSCSDVLILNTHDSNSKPFRLWPRVENVQYSLEHNHGNFIVITNSQAPNYRVLSLPVNDVYEELGLVETPYDVDKVAPIAGKCSVLVQHRPLVKIVDIDIFDQYLVLYETDQGLSRIRIQKLNVNTNHNNSNSKQDFVHYITDLPSAVGQIVPSLNADFYSDTLRFSFSSPIHPNFVYDYNMKSKKLTLLNDSQLLQAESRFYNLANLICSRISIESTDKTTQIPLTITHSKSLELNSKNPCLIEVYGSYGENITLQFNPFHALLLQRGWIIVKAHVRGGGELGQLHHEQGKLMKKMNSIHDFIQVCEYLKQENYTATEYLFGYASSAGGLTLSAAINKYLPQKLLNGAILRVPFCDPLTSMLEMNVKSTEINSNLLEQSEFGSPLQQIEQFHYLHSYSPYQNLPNTIEKGFPENFPSLFVFTSLFDSRVPYWQPLKYVAKLRELQALYHNSNRNSNNSECEPLILLSAADFGGHLSSFSSADRLREEALQIAFLYKVLGKEWTTKQHH